MIVVVVVVVTFEIVVVDRFFPNSGLGKCGECGRRKIECSGKPSRHRFETDQDWKRF